ncbi:preprotein translocase subunit SecG [Niabella ginsengisoli]|uniref:Protein-export membrane protein SecG n=1 Tax=Niabella ginsengisoli TaxID=522298 RepID=A0ABS9SH06_9BACT|nr:preprotein translocase subunit SecG [Niabella ginsengisoli]MCH5597657.1 preprotein translocase subunit SecG [Niabella ginsengisoli]
MTILFVILIILASVVLGFFVLIQNPKGGGLSGSFAGVSSQFMGVKQTNDVLERGTWIFAVIIAVLSLLSTFFISGSDAGNNGRLQDVGTAPVQAPAGQPINPSNTAPLPHLQLIQVSNTLPQKNKLVNIL